MFKGLAIFLSLIVAFAVGICPCGMGVLMARAGGEIVRSSSSSPSCPACCSQKNQEKHSKDCGESGPQKCATAISADVPSGHATAPTVHAQVAILIASMPLIENSVQSRRLSDAFAELSPSPPPTLLALSCSFNT